MVRKLTVQASYVVAQRAKEGALHVDLSKRRGIWPHRQICGANDPLRFEMQAKVRLIDGKN